MKLHHLCGAMAAALVLSQAGPGHALDGLQGDYIWPGDGFTAFLLYGQYQHASKFSLEGSGSIPDSELTVHSSTLRLVTYREIGGYRTAFQAFLPIADFADARVGGGDLATSSGVGDLTFGASFFPYVTEGPTGTNLGITLFLGTPTGNYDLGNANTGSGTWTLTPQIGLAQGLGGGFYLDAYADVAFSRTTDHDGVRVRIEPSYQVQSWLRYQVSPTTSLAVGYSARRGGKQYLDGVYANAQTHSDQIRVSAGTFLSPKVYLFGMIGKDVSSKDGYKDGSVAMLRLGYIF